MRIHPLLWAGITFLASCVEQRGQIATADEIVPTSIAISPSGRVALAWESTEWGEVWTRVALFDGSKWAQLGDGVSLARGKGLKAPAPEVAFQPDESLLLKTEDASAPGGSNGQLVVRQWNGTGWVPLGGIGGPLEGTAVIGARLAVDSGGAPVIGALVADPSTGGTLFTSRRYEASAWAPFAGDDALTSDESPASFDLALDASDRPVRLDVRPGAVVVSRWDGLAWQRSPTYAGGALADLVLDPSGAPAFVGIDRSAGLVMRFDGASWSPIVSGYFPGAPASLAISSNGGVFAGASQMLEVETGLSMSDHVLVTAPGTLVLRGTTEGAWDVPGTAISHFPEWASSAIRLAVGGPYQTDPVVVWSDRRICTQYDYWGCSEATAFLFASVPSR